MDERSGGCGKEFQIEINGNGSDDELFNSVVLSLKCSPKLPCPICWKLYWGFVQAYDRWAVSPELCSGKLFDEMLAARRAIEEREK